MVRKSGNRRCPVDIPFPNPRDFLNSVVTGCDHIHPYSILVYELEIELFIGLYMNSISNEYLICQLLITGYCWLVEYPLDIELLGWFMEDPFPNAHNSQLKSVPIRGRDLCTDPDFHKSFRLWWIENDWNHQHYYWNLYSWSTNITDCSRSFSCPIAFSCWFFSIAPMNAPIWIWVSPPYKVVPPQL